MAAKSKMLCVVLAVGSFASANPITFTASQGNLAASATFDTSGTDLVVTLSNTSLVDVLAPANVLTGLFFDVSGSPLGLTPASAVVPAGSMVLFGGTDPGGAVGGEWAYRAALAGAPHGAAYGISSSGFNLFGPPDVFPGTNLNGPVSPNGLNYGITSVGDDPVTGNAAVTGGEPLIQYSVVFHLSGLPAGFDPSAAISNVSFQYGTDLSEPNIPAPGSLACLAAAVLVAARRRR